MGYIYLSITGGIFLGIGVWRLITGTQQVSAIISLLLGIILLAFAWLKMQR